MNKSLRIVSIGAHPADIFDRCGGTLAHHISRGDYVACVSLTHGARMHDKAIIDSTHGREEIPDRPELLEIIAEQSNVKAEEARTACKILGVDNVYFLGEDDAILLVTQKVVRRLARLLRELRPDIVLTHFPKKEGSGPTDPHAITGQITMRAIEFAGQADLDDRKPPNNVAQVFFFGDCAANVRSGLWNADGGYTNDVFIDITDVIEKKLAAVKCMVSQGYNSSDYAHKILEAFGGAFGVAAGCAYAEPFISMRSEVHYHLPVTEHMLVVAKASDHENMARYSYRLPVD